VNRRQWLEQVRGRPFPAGQRILRGTLLALPMGSDGLITASDAVIAESTGMPVRTVARHLAKAVECGWLQRGVQRSGNGNRQRFLASIPTPQYAISGRTSTPELATNTPDQYAIDGVTSTPQSTYSQPTAVRHLVANINKESEQGEHMALDQDREQRDNHDDSRDNRNDQQTEQRADEQATLEPRSDTHSPLPGCLHCQRAIVFPSTPCLVHSVKAS
jgi:hypothetical protein